MNIKNNLSLSNETIKIRDEYQRKQMKAGKYELNSTDRGSHKNILKQKAWDPHVHALQELVPLKQKINSTKFDWPASSRYLSLQGQNQMKIGGGKVNNTLYQKSTNRKNVYKLKAPSQIITNI